MSKDFEDLDFEEQFLKDGGAKGQGELFFECGRHPDEKYIVVIHEGNVHILRPSGSVQFKKSSVLEDKDGYVKLLPVEILKKMPISEVPVILASIGAGFFVQNAIHSTTSGVIMYFEIFSGKYGFLTSTYHCLTLL